MAIVFTSPKKTKRAYFWVTVVVLLFLVILVSFIIFPPEFQNQMTAVKNVSQKPSTQINFSVIDSDKVKN